MNYLKHLVLFQIIIWSLILASCAEPTPKPVSERHAPPPAEKPTAPVVSKADIRYRVWVQDRGWTSYVCNNEETGYTAGKAGSGQTITAIQIKSEHPLKYTALMQDDIERAKWKLNGNDKWVGNGMVAGEAPTIMRLNAIRIVSDQHPIEYRVWCYDCGGWDGSKNSTWKLDGEIAGTLDPARLISSIQIRDYLEKNNVSYKICRYDDNSNWSSWQRTLAKDDKWNDEEPKDTANINAISIASYANIVYRICYANDKWTEYKTYKQTAGNPDSNRPITAIIIDSSLPLQYKVYQKVWVEDRKSWESKWSEPAINGQVAGVAYSDNPILAIQIKKMYR